MRNNAPILLGAGDFIQGPGVLDTAGSAVRSYGSNALIVAGKTAWDKTGKRVSRSLAQAGVLYQVHEFNGYCSDYQTDLVAEKAKGMNADVVIGIGGGKCLDTAKWGSDKAGLRVVTIPTSVATCAAYVSLCVLYDDTGTTLKSVFTRREVGAVILDTQFIASDSPVRSFASGIADALAKEPELYFSIRFSSDWEKSVLPDLGYDIACFNTKRFFAQGLKALEEVRAGACTETVEDIANTNVVLTGMVSCLASGGKQLAIAHSIYDCVCKHFKPQRARFLHGEIVSCGIAVQMAVNGEPQEKIEEILSFLRAIGTPTKLSDIDIDPTEQNLAVILNYVFSNMGIEDEQVKELIRTHIRRIC